MSAASASVRENKDANGTHEPERDSEAKVPAFSSPSTVSSLDLKRAFDCEPYQVACAWEILSPLYGILFRNEPPSPQLKGVASELLPQLCFLSLSHSSGILAPTPSSVPRVRPSSLKSTTSTLTHLSELAGTAILSLELDRFLRLSSPSIAVYHQFPSLGYTACSDIVGCVDARQVFGYEDETGKIPFLVVEGVMGSSSNSIFTKRDQLRAYASNLYNKCPPRELFLLLGLIISFPSKKDVSVAYELHIFTKASHSTKLIDIPFFHCEKSEVDDVAKLLEAIRHFQEIHSTAHPPLFEGFLQPKINTRVMGGSVIKVYDGLNRHGKGPFLRNYQLNHDSIPDAKFLITSARFNVLQYPILPGNHEIQHALQVHIITEKLVEMWDKGIVHGDIRLANMIFSGDEVKDQKEWRASLIDFDFGGKVGSVTYPKGYNMEIEDGRRGTAFPGDRITIYSDASALVNTLSTLVEPVDSGDGRWQDVVRHLHDLLFACFEYTPGCCQKILEKLKLACEHVGPVRAKVLVNNTGGTGSPAKTGAAQKFSRGHVHVPPMGTLKESVLEPNE